MQTVRHLGSQGRAGAVIGGGFYRHGMPLTLWLLVLLVPVCTSLLRVVGRRHAGAAGLRPEQEEQVTLGTTLTHSMQALAHFC
ncbi:MAG TPA: hypothetical protein VGP82_10360 [Ktedonobacterales bacterium]|nr:hypothetical protein [Ktedonobacterales bacterium]